MRMLYFFSLFFLTYGGMNAYAFLKLVRAFDIGRLKILLALFMLAMVAAPIFVRFSERAGFELVARAASWIGYLWLGFLFLFVTTALALDIFRGLLALFRLFGQNLPIRQVSAQVAFIIPFIAASAISVYGYFEARDIVTERVAIATSKLPSSTEKFRIVQISDVHLGLIVREKRLAAILDAVKKAKPDLLVCTGDLVDGQINNLTGLAEMLREIKPPYGKLAVTGNHEFYAGLPQALAFTRKAGFEMLRGETRMIGDILAIAGVDDPAGVRMGLAKKVSEKGLLSSLPQNKFILFLKHRPDVDPDAARYFNLQLSGHTHKGQIFPFDLVVWLYYPVPTGVLDPLHKGCWLYVSRGSGTWGPPIRFFSPPQITVIDLIREEGAVDQALESG